MRSGAIRSFVVVLSLAAWFGLSNHCALGMVEPRTEVKSSAAGCPMHSSPAKKTPAAKTPCCKDLRAVVAKCVNANPAVALIDSFGDATGIFAEPTNTARLLEGLDTGPPGCVSFAESVLQESLLAHAPPRS